MRAQRGPSPLSQKDVVSGVRESCRPFKCDFLNRLWEWAQDHIFRGQNEFATSLIDAWEIIIFFSLNIIDGLQNDSVLIWFIFNIIGLYLSILNLLFIHAQNKNINFFKKKLCKFLYFLYIFKLGYMK